MSRMTAHTLLAALLISASLAAPVAAHAQNAGRDLGIAAIVGQDAISSIDVNDRIKFIIATGNLPGTPDVIDRIRPAVIRSLIDERLQVQEAAKNNITITDQDVDQAVQGIEAQRNMPPGTIFNMLQARGVPKSTFTQQIRAQLLWSKLVTKKIRPLVKVSEEDIKQASQRIIQMPVAKKEVAAAVPQEMKIAVITLPVDKKPREAEVQRFAIKLVGDIRAGASFEEMSRQFSSVTASAGGKVESFWVRPDQLEPAIAQALAGAGKGDITNPVRAPEGYTIIKVYDTRPLPGAKTPPAKPSEPPPPAKDFEVNIKEILLKARPDTGSKEADALLEIGKAVAKNPGTCEDKGVANIADLKDVDIDVTFNRVMLSEISPAVKSIIETMKIGDISQPFASYEGIRLYMLCDRKETAAKPVDKDRIYRMLMQQKMELEAQKYMRNLRRDTYVEVRG